MKDRLGHLRQVQTDSDGFSTVEMDTLPECEAATASNSDQDLDVVLQETQQIRLEIQQIQNDISELRDVNYRALNQTSFSIATKRDSNAIGMDIKHRGDATLQRLHMMNALREDLEVKRGSSAARVTRTQYQYLTHALQEVMFSYYDAEMSHREACRRQIQGQMEVVGREDSKEELEKRMEGIQELFLGVAVLIEEQGSATDYIHKNVQTSEGIVQDAVVKVETAVRSDKKNPLKSLFCGCFPCYTVSK